LYIHPAVIADRSRIRGVTALATFCGRSAQRRSKAVPPQPKTAANSTRPLSGCTNLSTQLAKFKPVRMPFELLAPDSTRTALVDKLVEASNHLNPLLAAE